MSVAVTFSRPYYEQRFPPSGEAADSQTNENNEHENQKMMLIAAMLCVAGMAQAAAVVWGTGDVTTSPQITGRAGLLLTTASWAVIVKYTAGFAVDVDGSGQVTGYSGTGLSVMQAVNFGDGVAMTANKPGRFFAAFDDPALTVGDQYAILVFETGTKTSATTFGTAVSSGTYDTYLWTVDNATTEDFRWTGSQTLGMPASPEPTSLALLAVGAAVIGLRRKGRGGRTEVRLGKAALKCRTPKPCTVWSAGL